jgi:transposase-like protein
MGKSAKKRREGQGETIAEQRVLPLAALMFTLRRGLREFVVEAGMQALEALMEDERTEFCGPRYRHDNERRAMRAGHAPSELVMGGRKVRVARPRVRSTDGRQEIPLPTWQQFSDEDPLHKDAVEKMLVGVSTRKYKRALDEMPREVDEFGASKSAVSRRFVSATGKQLEQWLRRDLPPVRLAAIMIDGLAFDEHVVLIALGVDAEGKKHVLGLHEGATENQAACGALLDDIIGRGVPTLRSMLFVIDGAKALHKAIVARFGPRALVQRCQVHKARNVKDHLPDQLRPSVATTMRQAYAMRDYKAAKRQLENLARQLDDEHPGAAASVREGLAETLTVVRLGLPQSFARTFATTNPIENLNSGARWTCRNVKRWRGGTMVLRWACAAVREAEQRFRGVKSAKSGMPILVEALRQNDLRLENNIDAMAEAA